MPQVFIPSLMRTITNGVQEVNVEGRNVRQMIENLECQFPGIREQLCDENSMKSGLTVSVDGNVSSLGLFQKVRADSEIHFLPAIGGG